MSENPTTTETMTAVFPLVERAKSFAARITEGDGWWVANVVQKGRTVTWTPAIPAGSSTTRSEHFMDMLETVGYYGSDQRRKATLNGVRAPMSY